MQVVAVPADWTLYRAAGKGIFDQTQWRSGKIAGLSAGRHGVQSSIPGRGQ